MRVSNNSDDPAYFGGYIGENFQYLLEAGVDKQFLIERCKDAVAMSWASPTLKRQLLQEIAELEY